MEKRLHVANVGFEGGMLGLAIHFEHILDLDNLLSMALGLAVFDCLGHGFVLSRGLGDMGDIASKRAVQVLRIVVFENRFVVFSDVDHVLHQLEQVAFSFELFECVDYWRPLK